MVRQPDREPYEPAPQFESYEREGFNRWDDITPPVFEDEHTPRERTPRLLAAKFESSSREAEAIMHDPLASLRGDVKGITCALPPDQLPRDPYISTMVINHHRTLAFRVIRATAMVDDESIGITIHKEDPS